MSPNEKSVKRVLAGPSKIDRGVSRVVEFTDGSWGCETWAPGSGWRAGGASPDEFMFAAPVSAELASRMGIPASELKGPRATRGASASCSFATCSTSGSAPPRR
jgi:hypothetical protein